MGMNLAHFTQDQYAAQLRAMLPPGRVWPRDPNTVLGRLITGLAGSFWRSQNRANALVDEAFPGTTNELLSEWEQSLGLPDPCAGPGQTVAQRRQQVIGRLTASGGQSIPYLIAAAAAIQIPITIDQFTQARAGQARAGQPCNGPDWAFALRINAPQSLRSPARSGSAVAGDLLVTYGTQPLACLLRRIAPAHATLIINYY